MVMGTNILDLLSFLSIPALIGVLGIVVAWMAERRQRQSLHDERIRWRTQTDDRVKSLESNLTASEERLGARIEHLQGRLDDRWVSLEKEQSEQTGHLHELQRDVKRIEITVAEIKTFLKKAINGQD